MMMLLLLFIIILFFPAFKVYRDRDQFASLVREVAAPDVGRMGIEILSFTIKGKNLKKRKRGKLFTLKKVG